MGLTSVCDQCMSLRETTQYSHTQPRMEQPDQFSKLLSNCDCTKTTIFTRSRHCNSINYPKIQTRSRHNSSTIHPKIRIHSSLEEDLCEIQNKPLVTMRGLVVLGLCLVYTLVVFGVAAVARIVQSILVKPKVNAALEWRSRSLSGMKTVSVCDTLLSSKPKSIVIKAMTCRG